MQLSGFFNLWDIFEGNLSIESLYTVAAEHIMRHCMNGLNESGQLIRKM